MKNPGQEALLLKLGQRIRKLREKQGLTQEAMNEGIDPPSVTAVQQAEYGNKDLRVSTLLKIANRLNVRMKDLFDFE
ncbi:MAG TPA: helix-turn-helix transcriptional regulator [Leptospiraceae bacterium]|nr:helix-turn-helix transcriptional regulator [Leptospiraceae bacterium]